MVALDKAESIDLSMSQSSARTDSGECRCMPALYKAGSNNLSLSQCSARAVSIESRYISYSTRRGKPSFESENARAA